MRSRTVAIFLTFIFFSSLPSFSQKRKLYVRPGEKFSIRQGGKVSAGPELALITFSGFGLGASARYETPLKIIDHFTCTAMLGFVSYSTSASGDLGPSGTYKVSNSGLWVPILGGAKYYYPGRTFDGWYGSLELGFGIGSSTLSYSANAPATGAATPHTVESGLLVCPGIGCQFEKFDFSLRYVSTGMLMLRAAYVMDISFR